MDIWRPWIIDGLNIFVSDSREAARAFMIDVARRIYAQEAFPGGNQDDAWNLWRTMWVMADDCLAQTHLASICYGVPDGAIEFWQPPSMLESEGVVEELEKQANASVVNWVVIDTLDDFTNYDLRKSSGARHVTEPLNRMTRNLGIPVVCLCDFPETIPYYPYASNVGEIFSDGGLFKVHLFNSCHEDSIAFRMGKVSRAELKYSL